MDFLHDLLSSMCGPCHCDIRCNGDEAVDPNLLWRVPFVSVTGCGSENILNGSLSRVLTLLKEPLFVVMLTVTERLTKIYHCHFST